MHKLPRGSRPERQHAWHLSVKTRSVCSHFAGDPTLPLKLPELLLSTFGACRRRGVDEPMASMNVGWFLRRDWGTHPKSTYQDRTVHEELPATMRPLRPPGAAPFRSRRSPTRRSRSQPPRHRAHDRGFGRWRNRSDLRDCRNNAQIEAREPMPHFNHGVYLRNSALQLRQPMAKAGGGCASEGGRRAARLAAPGEAPSRQRQPATPSSLKTV